MKAQGAKRKTASRVLPQLAVLLPVLLAGISPTRRAAVVGGLRYRLGRPAGRPCGHCAPVLYLSQGWRVVGSEGLLPRPVPQFLTRADRPECGR